MRLPRPGRVAAAMAVAAMAVAALAAPAGAAAPAPPAAAPGLRLAGQTPFVTSSGTWRAELEVDAPSPGTDRVYTAVYSRLTSRSDFDQAVGGHPPGYQRWYQMSSPLAGAAGGAAGVPVAVDIPVNPRGGGGLEAQSGSAVYPVAFQVVDASSVPVGKPIVTFLVFASAPPASSHRLAVSLTVPVRGPADATPTPTPLPAGASSALASLVAALSAHSSVPVTLDVAPEVLDRLAAGGATDRATLASLASSAPSDQVLASPYYPLNRSGLYAAGLGVELQTEYGAGAAALDARLHQQPAADAAAVGGGLDETSFSALLSSGVSRLVVPDADLSPLSPAQRQITFASPTTVTAERGGSAAVMAADPELSGYLTLSGSAVPAGDAVLAGEQLLGGLALVQLEAPSDARGIALLATGGQPVDPTVLRTVLAGLEGNPLLAASTIDDLFRTVPAATPEVSRGLVDTHPAAGLVGAPSLRAARDSVDGLAGIAPDRGQVIGQARRQLLLAASSAVTPAGRAGIVARVQSTVRRAEAGISLPGSSSITLTARTGTIPLTVLSNPSLRARVQLRIASPKLTFRPFATAAGTCTVSDSSTETCQLTLGSEATTLRVPVEARTSGVFAMSVTLSSPDGTVVLASNRDTVRSTAFSGVGVVLIVVAALGLAVWWVRNARHGRRARQLVDPEGEEVIRLPDGPAGADPDAPGAEHDPGSVSEPVTTWLDDDPVLSEFFSSPAPDFDTDLGSNGDRVSPSGRRRGPNP